MQSVPKKSRLNGFWQEKKAMFPLRDLVKSEDITNAVVFLASDRARMITGNAIDVDAGMSLCWGLIPSETHANGEGQPKQK